MKDIFSILTERRILEAIARGDFKNLPGAGKPLMIEGLYLLPRKLRAAYIILNNSGYLDQAKQENKRFLPPTTDHFHLSDVDSSISKQELSEIILQHNVMMDCRRRK
ncbi:MAG TPA: DUF1992 domain-containing protein [Desulfosporosinus sp.]|nr:DUF1992 domain-containing protein [Desulfosporosinus sp.]